MAIAPWWRYANQRAPGGSRWELARAVADEYDRNPSFAHRLDAILKELPESQRDSRSGRSGPKNTSSNVPVPDIYREFSSLGESEFRLWIQRLSLPVLREIIRSHDIDATRRTTKWHDSEKLGNFITDQLSARSSRGSAFLRGDLASRERPVFVVPTSQDRNVLDDAVEVGSVVVLASGGPRMTVVNLSGDKVVCSWIDSDGKSQHGAFPISALRPYSRSMPLAWAAVCN